MSQQIRDLIGNDIWFDLLEEKGVFQSPEFIALGSFLREEYKRNIILPPKENMFRALALTPLDTIKVVIVGQDPYPSEEADGLAFSVGENSIQTKMPPSLKAIFEEIEEDVYNGFKVEQDWNLERWSSQGVLLLNRVLTVRHKQPKSHYNRGWEKVTEAIIKVCSEHYKNRKVFMLWGSEAKKLEPIIDERTHLILKSGHPATKFYETDYWTGNKHFSQANKFLRDFNNEGITW
jgi:uracil-DNA glycosylase